jgi:GNAT superfamily N-acetyltransferase
MTDNSIIRFVKKEELFELILLCEQHAEFEKSEYYRENKHKLLEQYLFAKSPSLFCLVVEYENKLIGYTTYMKQFSTWDANYYVYMDCLFLNDESRGLGIGKRLINRIKKEAINMNCSLIQWQTPEFNKRAMKFYNKTGAKSKAKKRYFLKI